MSLYFISGKQIELGKLIGEGGEGKVYLSSTASDRAIKIYSDTSDSLRAAKIERMVTFGLSKISSLISFPDEIVKGSDGQVVGFSMKFVRDHQQVHNLYGVKSRKQFFPNADYRFLIRVAANIARAFAQVHSYPCVIGDVNHSGVLVSKDATVALIDADSFQLNDNQKIYPCVVGVPDFTPPELQGKSLRNVERSQTHDQFGLAVLIFQVLVMGRHPFAGKGQDLSLEDSIAKYLFAYSNNKNSGILPPPGVPTLDYLPLQISRAFDFSFGNTSANRRTTAVEWISLLTEMESSLAKCSTNEKHYYYQQPKGCPWCKMEGATGAILFNGGVTLISSAVTMSDIERILSEILSFKIVESNLIPKLPELTKKSPTPQSKFSKIAAFGRKGLSWGIWSLMFGTLVLFFNYPHILWLILAALFGWAAHHIGKNKDNSLVIKYKNLNIEWDSKLQQWQEKLSGKVLQIRVNLEKTINDLKTLDKEKDVKLKKLKEGHRDKQLQNHLDKFLIKNEKIENIRKSLVAILASHGIESAADIEYNKIRSIPQFGDIRTSNLVTWRRECEQSFKYNPALQNNDISAQNQIINEFELKMRDKKNSIVQQKKTFDLYVTEINKANQFEDTELSRIHLELEQLKIDLVSVNIPIPQKKSTTSQFHKINSTPASSTWGKSSAAQSQSNLNLNPNCPSCSAQMVKRTGRRGNFWGCSRYPMCKTTKNY